MIIVGLDTETTGKLDPAHRVIELCLQRWAFDPGTHNSALIKTSTWRFNPDRSIDAAAFRAHGISQEDLADCKPLGIHAGDIVAELEGVDLIVAHNGLDFDKVFMTWELERAGIALPSSPWFDTMQSGRWATALGKVPNLKELCWACDVEYDPAKAHAAEYDVLVMMKCFFFGVKSGNFTL